MSGKTPTQVVLVQSGDSTSLLRVVSGRAQVDVISMPALSGLVDSVSLRGHTGGTYVRVTANNSLCVTGGGGSSTGNNTVVFGANTWKIRATGYGPIMTADHSFVETSLSGLNTRLDSSPASTYSASVICEDYLYFMFSGLITRTGVPTDIQFKIQFKSNSTWVPYRPDFWSDLRWTDTAVGANGLPFALDGLCVGKKIRAFVTATGLTAGSHFFTLSNMALGLKA